MIQSAWASNTAGLANLLQAAVLLKNRGADDFIESTAWEVSAAWCPCHLINCRLSFYQSTEGEQIDSSHTLVFISHHIDEAETASWRRDVYEASQPISQACIYAEPLLPFQLLCWHPFKSLEVIKHVSSSLLVLWNVYYSSLLLMAKETMIKLQNRWDLNTWITRVAVRTCDQATVH